MTLVKVTDYEAELERVNKDLAELAPSAFIPPLHSETTTKYLYRRYQKISLNGQLGDLSSLESAIDRAIEELGAAEDLCLLKANLNFKLHRLTQTRQALLMAPALLNRVEGRSLTADVDFQSGRYADAEKALEALIEEDHTWDNLARLAHMRLKMGEFTSADELYLEAEDELTAKEMRSYAWIEVQRGLVDAVQGEFEQAMEHLVRADRAYTGFWLVQEHIGDLHAAQGNRRQALAIYHDVLQSVRKPELLQKTGELYREQGERVKAESLFEEALTTYLQSAEAGEVHYYHHLVEFYAAARPNPEECLHWALRDVTVRQNFGTQSALAWALYLNQRFCAAADQMTEALRSGVRDAGIFAKAADVYKAAGFRGKSHLYEHKAGVINRRQHFHVHI